MPEALNNIRELATYMDNPGEAHWRAMERLIGYIAGQEVVELRMMKPKDLKVYAYVDSNYATNKETRKSVTGYIVTVGGCFVSASSKTQPSVTLSSTEAEYVAASMCATEIQFIQMLIEELMPAAKTRPATLFEDNTGAMFLMENQAVGNRTKHIDIRWHHLRSLLKGESPKLRVAFTRSEGNFADLETKNVSEAIHDKLATALKSGEISRIIFADLEREDVKKQHVSSLMRMNPVPTCMYVDGGTYWECSACWERFEEHVRKFQDYKEDSEQYHHHLTKGDDVNQQDKSYHEECCCAHEVGKIYGSKTAAGKIYDHVNTFVSEEVHDNSSVESGGEQYKYEV